MNLSACPFVINGHTQSTAYVLGEIEAEVLAEEYMGCVRLWLVGGWGRQGRRCCRFGELCVYEG
jgi:hypothetical protein